MITAQLRQLIRDRSSKLTASRSTIGLDGFVDTVVKVVRSKQHTSSYFKTIAEFGEFTREKGGMNFSLELEEQITKSGGNAPIMGQALARLGTPVQVIGALGYPNLHPVFQPLQRELSLTSYANPGLSTAMEFGDGKILLAQMSELNKADWTTLRDRVGLEALRQYFDNQSLYALVNWSEPDHTTSMWKGILEEVIEKSSVGKPIGFFDLADCTRRDPAAIREVATLLRKFGKYWKVVLGVNKNEAHILYQAMTQETSTNLHHLGDELFRTLQIDCLVIHHSKEALGWNSEGSVVVPTEPVIHPKISTGAGDNFNAGLAAGLLMELNLEQSLTLGHAVAAAYMRKGESCTLNDLLN